MSILFVFAPFIAYGLGAWTAFDILWADHQKDFDETWERGYRFGLEHARKSIERLEGSRD